MTTTKDLLRSEWIGLNVKIIKSTNKTLDGIEGKVVDETKHAFILQNMNTKKRVLKSHCFFQVTLDNKQFVVEGKMLEKRPEDRIKTK
ncbi:ribonuclease P protein subunit [Candidatus Woesearchaeota archaeon]|jgi:ribonuclease P protein subunit POP4|nr:ribonuclease P protein subunit [Candidatus Woesearchaeota archaeon]